MTPSPSTPSCRPGRVGVPLDALVLAGRFPTVSEHGGLPLRWGMNHGVSD
jgi:hypothetical protein